MIHPRAFALALCLAGPAGAAPLTGPTLAAASNFGQHWNPAMLEAARKFGVRSLRDAVYWSEVERDGRFRFATPTTTWPDRLDGITMSLTVNNGNPAYDGGKTPYTQGAIDAFAHDAAVTALRFPAVKAVEVGNEINAQNFVTGIVREEGLATRPERYLAILKATYTAVKSARPEVHILGGGLHSIPVAYVRRLFALGAASYMDALAFHPYTTPAEQLVRQIALLRTVPGLETMPLEATEFGDPNPETAPGYLMRAYCQMALSGVTRTVWYPLNPRGDGLTPLIGRDLKPTAVGQTFALLQRTAEHRPVSDAAPDPFTYGCRFGADTLMIWGAPRAVTLAPGQTALSPTGTTLAGPLTLSEDTPLLILGPGTPALAPQQVLADSYDQYAFPGSGVTDGFDRYVLDNGTRVPLILMPGQGAPGQPWTPHLAAKGNPSVRLESQTLLPGGDAAHPVRIAQDWHAAAAERVTAEIALAPAKRSADGVRLIVLLNGKVLRDTVVSGESDWTSPPLDVAKGDVLSVRVGPNGTSKGDVTRYRITIRKAG